MSDLFACRLKVTFSKDESVYRVVDVPKDKDLEFLHLTMLASFGLSPGEIASFFVVQKGTWNRMMEIPMIKTYDPDEKGEEKIELACMEDVEIGNAIGQELPQLIYEYDSMLQWEFKVEWVEDREKSDRFDYPILVEEGGKAPDQNLAKIAFISDNTSDDDEDIFTSGGGYGDYDDDDYGNG